MAKISEGNLYGRSFFLDDKWNTSPPLELYTDAAGSKGYGAIFGPHWFFGSFTDQWQSFNITFLELFPIAISVRIWGPQMANRCYKYRVDWFGSLSLFFCSC